ncbi:MAG TPA: Nramp family divalent metal transporter [Sedimentisphaerales bacterium]|nr:Nramp family divalent metal transporter [Sedimentisphaerales bacterium]
MHSKLVKKIALALAAVGPGLFLIGYNIGTGSVTTMAKAGAEHGMALFWALVLSCVFTYVLMVAYGRITLVTGKTALFNIKNNFRMGKILAIYILVALIMGELLSLMGVMGIVADLLKEGSRLLFGSEGFSTFWITFVLVIGLYLLLWYGRYPAFEKVLTFFVILMGLCFVVVFFMVKPNLSAVASGLVPRIPNQAGAFGLVAAMAGTTCSAAVFIMRSTVVAEKGWTVKDLKGEKRDAFVSAAMMLFLSAVIMAVSAGTLHVMGLKLVDTVEMIHLFEPIGGKIAAFILILGITGAGLSTVFPIILIAPWLICDYTGRPRNLHSGLFRVLCFVGILFCFGMQFMESRPPALMIFSQAFQACILPAAVVPILILINRKELMGEHAAGRKMNIGLWLVLAFSLVTTYFAIFELLS